MRLAELPASRVTLDLDDKTAIEHTLSEARPEVILHAAWYANPQDYLTSPMALASLRATTTLFQTAARQGCRRFVGIGTCLEYGRCDQPRSENHACEPRTLYAACKLSAWLVCRALAAQVGVSAVWARLFYLYGPDENPGRILPALRGALRAGQTFPMTEGTQIRDYLHVDDAGRALALLCKREIEGVVNVASGQPISVRDFALTAASVLGAKSQLRIGEIPMRRDEEMFVVADIARLRGLGFEPKHLTLREGLDHALKNWRTA
jgi:nucleoside-diphosphate-sugar epimerase